MPKKQITSSQAARVPCSMLALRTYAYERSRDGKNITRIIGYIVNEGDVPCRIYTPGFQGPQLNRKAKKGERFEPLPLWETPSAVGEKGNDYVTLKPRAFYGRELTAMVGLAAFNETYDVSCEYLVYKAGKDGISTEVDRVLKSE